MREIKFRAWNKNNNQMVHCFYPVVRGGINIFDFGFLKHWSQYSDPMQSTGLLDRTGKEIYEGDIIIFAGDECWSCGAKRPSTNFTPHEVVFALFGWDGWIAVNRKDPDRHYLMAECWKDCEVIGNIYENSHLL